MIILRLKHNFSTVRTMYKWLLLNTFAIIARIPHGASPQGEPKKYTRAGKTVLFLKRLDGELL